jgi:glycosyltransferase involved in cell wall biosynthesis
MERKRIGLIFSYDELWLGGTYYILNLVNALNVLEENNKPELVIFSNPKDFEILSKDTQYPHLIFEYLSDNPQSKFLRLMNKLSKKIIGNKIFKSYCTEPVDAVFPYRSNAFFKKIPNEKRIYWIPDFQEKHFPEFYSKEHLANEKIKNSDIVLTAKKLVLSSESALNDLKTYYPEFRVKPYVVHFAVKIPDLNGSEDFDVLNKFQLPNVFFFAPNQFWRHKNHILVIKAVEILKSKGIKVMVAFSGKEHDYRSPGYTESIKNYVVENDLQENIKFLAFLDRVDQLKLMELSAAIIQPSLFEGWSTVIEEAMAMNKMVLASDLDVNKEQLGDKGIYFDRNDANECAEVIERFLESPTPVSFDYQKKQLDFACDFMSCLN